MFSYCEKLTEINFSNSDFTNITGEDVFKNCTGLTIIFTPKIMGDNIIELPFGNYRIKQDNNYSKEKYDSLSRNVENVTIERYSFPNTEWQNDYEYELATVNEEGKLGTKEFNLGTEKVGERYIILNKYYFVDKKDSCSIVTPYSNILSIASSKIGYS